jgi:hypothetical protein
MEFPPTPSLIAPNYDFSCAPLILSNRNKQSNGPAVGGCDEIDNMWPCSHKCD